ncbi:MAG: exodeoxyribonuclease III [Candidatus ainarchaeum sp.]|nr:exodeoxyribonuclease III [Candidatus ainarchaeum sp.]
MKIIAWNVNGIRAIMKKDFLKFFNETKADIYCLQEIKVHNDDVPDEIASFGSFNGYKTYFNGAKRKGYSGTGIISKIPPLDNKNGFNSKIFDDEGRVQTFELKDFFLLNVYAPNSKHGLLRLGEKIEFNEQFINYCEKLREKKPVIFCGDLNVAHKEIDLANPKQNEESPGFSIEERNAFSEQLEKGYIDTFRMFTKAPDQYTWWSYRFNARKRNIGWRIDYFVASKELKSKIKSSKILSNVLGSDHCPIELEINV